MRYSEGQSELANALALAQGEIENSTKDSVNPHFRSKYTSLSEALNVVRPVFAKHGLSVVQMPTFQDNKMFLTTRVMHKSGQFVEGDYQIKPVKEDPQGYGSAVTYARRYSLMAVAGIAPEDDDGNEASGKEEKEQPKQEAKPDPKPRFTAPEGKNQEPKAEAGNAAQYVPAAKLHDLLKLVQKLQPELTVDQAKAKIVDEAGKIGVTNLKAMTQAQYVKVEDSIRQVAL